MSLRALARVNLAAIERNTARLRRELSDGRLCAVVKADGYGHGAIPELLFEPGQRAQGSRIGSGRCSQRRQPPARDVTPDVRVTFFGREKTGGRGPAPGQPAADWNCFRIAPRPRPGTP